ncbi:Hypothetical predicted protein [Paramuricea clavata]|uniref:Coiled-coil domain-containing protein n=1 Tax=Paramuricea clavata TaxID=317549 RepID=A0A6S7JRC6_PARCT|nr:Hypothetical predicted protein [Paramuricea clavata]
MPKKFQGTNTKAEAARARKSETKNAEKARKEKDTEDKYWESWESSDRNENKRKERKEDKERKRLEQLEKKRAAKELLEAEESKQKGKTTSAKVTRSEISSLQEKEAEKRKAAAAKPAKKNVTVDDAPPEENINHLVVDTLAAEGGVEARNVEDAISVLSVDDKQESHPEKRMKAAFAEERLPALKAENPNMRLSQIKQMLRKEWLKSPDNPLNQNFVAYNK